jgi:glucose-1-phosphate cytidylyltransferase
MPAARFGALDIEADGKVASFLEKPRGDGGRVNGGFFVLSPKAIDYIEGDETAWEVAPLTRLCTEGQLMAYEHDGFWQPMDTLRDKMHLEELFLAGKAPWKVWA